MPNWCNNHVTISHKDPREIQRINDAFYNKKELFGEFFPTPKELLIDACPGTDNAEMLKQYAANREKFGFETWYYWNVANWGTKWDVECDSGDTAQELSDDCTEIKLYFDTAWAPPIQWYEQMRDIGFTIQGFYHESGMTFVGCWEDGVDDYYEYESLNSNDIESRLPPYIVKEFDLAAMVSEWEQTSDLDLDDEDETMGSGMDSDSDEDEPTTNLS